MGLLSKLVSNWRRRRKRRVESRDVVLYTRSGCCLCDQAEALLREQGLSPRAVDVDQDVDLRERYGCCVPVVEIDGKVRFRGRVDPMLLRRLLAATPEA